MCRLSFIISLVLFVNFTSGQSPHGKGLKIDCDVCHSGDSWYVDLTKMKFDHNTTKFKLSGQHQSIDCKRCHTSLVFSKGEMECRNCHTDMHNGTVGYDCSRCHNTNSWIITNITGLHQQSRFPLVGMHAVADCYSCHKSGSLLQFEPLGIDCYDCHKDKYLATTSPNHQTAGYPTNCLECHLMTAPDWLASSINHNFFPLTGGHAIGCVQCHKSGTFDKLPTDCNSCHSANYDATTNPPHAASQIPRTCENCHNINGWSPATFNHNATAFPLTGAHTSVTCVQCHASGYVNTSPLCNSCHSANYDATTNPPHAASQFPRTCESCHNTTAWTPATFDHSKTNFPLTGAHKTVACSQCHASGYVGTPTACNACHMAQYNATTNPAHAPAQFPTTCETCHNTTAWAPSTFNHDGLYFPIYSGRHNGTWTLCSQCHPTASNFASFTCLSCHAHDQAPMNSAHSDVSGYSYNSAACYSCHPRGTGGD
jgi:hypothetical protein